MTGLKVVNKSGYFKIRSRDLYGCEAALACPVEEVRPGFGSEAHLLLLFWRNVFQTTAVPVGFAVFYFAKIDDAALLGYNVDLAKARAPVLQYNCVPF